MKPLGIVNITGKYCLSGSVQMRQPKVWHTGNMAEGSKPKIARSPLHLSYVSWATMFSHYMNKITSSQCFIYIKLGSQMYEGRPPKTLEFIYKNYAFIVTC